MKLTYHGHSCFAIETDNHKLWLDPFITGNPSTTIKAEEVKADYILLSHGHEDHYGDTNTIAKNTGAVVIANFEIASYAQKHGCKMHPLHIGGGNTFPFGHAKLTIAFHGSSLPDGSYGGQPAGILLTIEGKKIYFAGDTALFYDMTLIGEEGIDLAILPIGDNFTMGPDDAVKAVNLLKPKHVIPMHYDTWELIAQDAEDWVNRVSRELGVRGTVLESGQTFNL
jgi:L-ascorbate metabolism protein UlaG (beta-lactamase superfamily)